MDVRCSAAEMYYLSLTAKLQVTGGCAPSFAQDTRAPASI